jgi:hypothetical protein
MFRAIGTVIVLLVLVRLFGPVFDALSDALIASFELVETSANMATVELYQLPRD